VAANNFVAGDPEKGPKQVCSGAIDACCLPTSCFAWRPVCQQFTDFRPYLAGVMFGAKAPDRSDLAKLGTLNVRNTKEKYGWALTALTKFAS